MNRRKFLGSAFMAGGVMQRGVTQGRLMGGTGNPPTIPTPTLIESFDSTTGFTATGSTLATDTTHKVEGTGSLQTTGDGAAATAYGTKTLSGVNPSSYGVVAVYCNRQTSGNFQSVSPSLFRGASLGQVTFSNTTAKFRQGGMWLAWNMAAEMSAVAALGSGTLSVRMKTDQIGDKASVVSWDGLYANAAGRPTVVLTFDDVTSQVYSTVYPILRSLGLKGTCYVPNTYVGNANRMTLAQLQELYAAGWDMGCDSTDDSAFTGMASTAAALTDIQTVQAYLTANGIDRAKNHFCWPNGTWNESIAAAFAGAGLKSGRTTEPQSIYDRFGLGDIGMTIPSQGFASSTAVSVAIARVEEAKSRGTTQPFHWHDISDNPSAIGWQTYKFSAFMRYLSAQWVAGLVDVLTVSQWDRRTSAAVVGA